MIEPSADLVTALESEVLGEAAFRTACVTSLSAAKREKLRALWQLETQTKRRLLKYCEENNIAVPGMGWLALKSVVLGLLFNLFPWKLLMKSFLNETEKFLEVFQRLLEHADEGSRDFFQHMVDHELAIQSFARLESEGRPGESIAPVLKLLD